MNLHTSRSHFNHLIYLNRATHQSLLKNIFPYYSPDESLCPVKALQVYEKCTASFRTGESKSTLFLSWIRKHEPVSSSTIARWLRTCLQDADVDTGTFKAHSVRGAACSTAAWSGVTTTDILNAADWSLFSSFTIEKLETNQCLEYLSCCLLILHTYMLIWKRSLLKCNLQMAQGTKCLHDICNDLRKVKLKYQHVHPAPTPHINTVYLVYLHFLIG